MDAGFYFFFVGIHFWKSPRRKIFAVPIDNVYAALGDSSVQSASSSRGLKRSSDYCNDNHLMKKTLESVESKIDFMMTDILQVKENFDQAIRLTKDTPIPMDLKKSIKDHFKCRICLTSPLNPPVVVMKCCRVILGCEACVNAWFAGDDALTKGCPSCRIERGYGETMILRELEDFLTTVKCLQEVTISQE